jgi:phosphate transport system substrate-binding protein
MESVGGGTRARSVRSSVLALGLLAACGQRVDPPPPPPELVVAGSTSMRAVVDRLVGLLRAARPELRIAVEGGGSARGIRAVGTGEVEIGATCRPPKHHELRVFPALLYHRVAVDGISVVVHRSNPVRALSMADLRAIYLGQVTDWRAFGGNGGILPIAATTSHGTFDGFADGLQLDGEDAPEHGTVLLRPRGAKSGGTAVTAVDGTAAMLAAVVANANAIVCVSTGAANAMRARGAAITVLALDGVEPTDANLVSGRYPFHRSLYLVTRGAPTGLARELVDLATGAGAERALRAVNVVPAAAPALAAPGR